jgi:uncharacterized membrane protein
MPNLVVITFDGPDKAGEVLETLRSDQYEDSIGLDDSAVVVKDEEGIVQVDNEVDRGIKVGAVGGGLLGLLIGLLFGGPIASLVLGAIAGALGGDLANLGIDQRFINEVADAMKPGTSALFVMVREADPNATVEALEPFEGTVYYAHLPEEAEQELRRALSEDE